MSLHNKFWDAVEWLIGHRLTNKVYYGPQCFWLATRHWLIYYKIMTQPKGWSRNRTNMRKPAKRHKIIATWILVMWIVGGFTYLTVTLFNLHILAPTATLPDKSASVVCGAAFLYDDKVPFKVENVAKLEALAKATCKGRDPRPTTNHRHPDGDLKHAVLIGGEVCTINWELTPKAHLAAFTDVCVNKQP